MKEALVKPLIKKKQLGTVNSNYRPVSNLSFISKIVEKTTLEQFTIIATSIVYYLNISQPTEDTTVVKPA